MCVSIFIPMSTASKCLDKVMHSCNTWHGNQRRDNKNHRCQTRKSQKHLNERHRNQKYGSQKHRNTKGTRNMQSNKSERTNRRRTACTWPTPVFRRQNSHHPTNVFSSTKDSSLCPPEERKSSDVTWIACHALCSTGNLLGRILVD